MIVDSPGSGPEPRSLPSVTPDGMARLAAMRAFAPARSVSTTAVTFHSAGAVLVIGPEPDALDAARRLGPPLACAVLVPPAVSEPQARTTGRGDWSNVPVVRGVLQEVSGHLGSFRAAVATDQGKVDITPLAGQGRDGFDLVLDLNVPPAIDWDIPPPGYFRTHGDRRRLEEALVEMPEMVGEFEKPRFFRYDPDICAHGARGLPGCTRCIDACPTHAIASIGEKVEVDPHLCQGGGSCATACPTGAITYAYPPLSQLLEGVKGSLQAYRAHGGKRPCLLFHDAQRGPSRVAQLASRIPEWIVPLEVEELGSVGMDAWFAALAYGAHQVALLPTGDTAPRVMAELDAQLGFAQAILSGMGYAPERLLLLSTDDQAVIDALQSPSSQQEFPPASFQAFDEKRTMLRLAIDHLYASAPSPSRKSELPAGAPFGEIIVDRGTCTLCMACVAVCPASALSDGNDMPQLLFREANCVQCGLCRTACPEDAIQLAPRIAYDAELRDRARVLNEEVPFRCISCGKPFATQKMMQAMTEKLRGHWMYQDAGALRRLQMCGDCRVKALFADRDGSFEATKGR